MTDALMFHVPDGGEVEITNGLLKTTEGYETAAYLSLFGGNEQDGGDEDTARKQWWGNSTESDPARHYRSRTQYLLRSLPAVPANLRALEDAGEGDLAWFVEREIATLVAVTVRLTGINRVRIEARIDIDGTTHRFLFDRSWGSPA
jgi:phage gp46-like protein